MENKQAFEMALKALRENIADKVEFFNGLAKHGKRVQDVYRVDVLDPLMEAQETIYRMLEGK